VQGEASGPGVEALRPCLLLQLWRPATDGGRGCTGICRLLQVYILLSILEVCYKCFIWMLQSRFGCCICYHGYICMLQTSVLNVSSVFRRCCKCFIWKFHMFHTYVASIYLDIAYICNGFQKLLGISQVFQTYVASVSPVSDVCYKCFIWML
jgi:hypothetical protein